MKFCVNILLILIFFGKTSLLYSEEISDNESTFKIIDATNRIKQLGEGYRYISNAALEKQAMKKISSLRQLNRDITVEDFLGASIESIKVESIRGNMSFEEVHLQILDTLNRVILTSTDISSEPPMLFQGWSEYVGEGITASICFKIDEDNPPDHRNKPCGYPMQIAGAGNYLFFEDIDGTFWWHRWASYSPY